MPVADDGVPIAVQVINPQEVKSTISSYTTYNVTGEDKEGRNWGERRQVRVLQEIQRL